MNKYIFYITVLIFFSCNNEKKPDDTFRNDFGMYTILINEVDFHSFYLESQIEHEISNLRNSNRLDIEIATVDSITKLYTSNIDKILSELSQDIYDENYNIVPENQNLLMDYKKVNSYFFKGDSISKNAVLYKECAEKYSSEILKYFNSPIYIKRISGALTTDYAQDRYGNQIEYFAYIYKDTPLVATLVHLKNLKKSALEYEQQFLLNKSCLLNNH